MSENIPLLQVKNIDKYFSGLAGSKIQVLDKINFSINEESGGNIYSILASFGAGKSTLLRIISGLEKPSSGEVILAGNNYYNPNGEIVLIPSNPSSFPWYNVKQDLEFALSIKNKQTKNKNFSIDNILLLLELDGYEEHFPHEKSSGFRFRIALGRALIVEPSIILLDDPFKNLDSETQHEIYNLIKNVSLQFNIHFILTTTNITEALILSNYILLMDKNPGRILKKIKLENDKTKINADIFTAYRNEINSVFASFTDSPLISVIS